MSVSPTVNGPSVVMRSLRVWTTLVARGEEVIFQAVVVAASKQEAEWMAFEGVDFIPVPGDLVLTDELRPDHEPRVIVAVVTEED